MNATGLSLVKSFDVLAAQAKNKKFKSALLQIRERINKGESLSEALSGYREIFSELFLNMVKVGEESGTLEEIFKNLSLQLEKEHELKSKIQNAMIYPAVVLLTMLGVAVVIVAVVIPRLNTFFSSLNAPIPFYTKIMLGSGNFAAAHWPLLIIVPVVLLVFLWLVSKTRQGKWLMDTFLLKLPFFSLLVKESNCAILIRSLSSLISAGVPIVTSLEVSSKVVGNYYFKKAVDMAAAKVKGGENLSSALKDFENVFPTGMIEMVQVGEETGKTSAILKKLAEFYEQELADATEKLSTAIEPILIVIMGVAVGVFAFSIISPMYSMLGSIQ